VEAVVLGRTVSGPYYDLRIALPDTLARLDNVEGLISINMEPPASGPEIELTIGTIDGVERTEDYVRRQVEIVTKSSILAFRRRERTIGMELEDPGWFSQTKLGRALGLGED
jgi:hypothetical protein